MDGEDWGTFLWIKWNKFTQSHLRRASSSIERALWTTQKSQKSWQKLQIAFIITTRLRETLSQRKLRFEFGFFISMLCAVLLLCASGPISSVSISLAECVDSVHCSFRRNRKSLISHSIASFFPILIEQRESIWITLYNSIEQPKRVHAKKKEKKSLSMEKKKKYRQ